MKKVEFWDWVDIIRKKKTVPKELDFSNFSPYIVLRSLAMNPSIIPLVNKLNKYTYAVPKELLFRLYYYVIPYQSGFIKYIKKDKKEKYIECLMKYYKISRKDAGEYVKILNEEELKRIEKVIKGGGHV